ncbi:RNA polymerase factor sigma-54 [Acetobacter aceti NRIC 0242]|uniref:RNA polymerase sigma-54 factor n=1 Tax=Acetobacter aceti NBRC 14818 TaxID=887700 RepID=A0AB33IJM8_ACEAC|nr:RNA polymerase factor sigma-54 [Acetobacter aceti]TCS32037.1 RNA polymerase RpoN-/SigL-like sigma 54 subunit [Acetobacter aceti NBRC 14818]BCK77342.1 RNA polymerase sigma-54 factor 1 [Acetobacter aceti NBRC 14818]GAN58971.1 DNA-directed RNA polymerase sigma-54 factor RpoN [Acetobacter aceti NBRC 14818]GBO81697.1 RNA polymerase factor sigma-54 [Acetobacter aceti NRIC 0242]
MVTLPGLHLRQTHNLAMTPQLRLAIRLLQMTSAEMEALVEEELERNPFLVREETETPVTPTDSVSLSSNEAAAPEETSLDISFAEEAASGGFDDTYSEEGSPQDWRQRYGDGDQDIAAHMPTLSERLDEQLRLTPLFTEQQRVIGCALIEHLDAAGRLDCSLGTIAEEIGVSAATVENVRQSMMLFEPVGLFACSLRECLAAQLRSRNRLDPAMSILLDHLDKVACKDYRSLQQLCGVDEADFAEMISELHHLDPKPGFEALAANTSSRIADVFVQQAPDGQWSVRINEDTLPRLYLDQALLEKTRKSSPTSDRPFIQNQAHHASWLVRSIEQRTKTLLRVSLEIIKHQSDFLSSGASFMRPLTMKTVATETGLHESTISRITTGKYIATPQGLFELKYFFTRKISSLHISKEHSAEAVRYKIQKMISQETGTHILSDEEIVQNLRKEGIDIARRTVAKYRDALHIGNSVQRKREKAASA